MARKIPFPTSLTQKDIELNDALRITDADQHQPVESTALFDSGQDILTQQLYKQLLSLAIGTGCSVDPNIELIYFPEYGFIPQERYL